MCKIAGQQHSGSLVHFDTILAPLSLDLFFLLLNQFSNYKRAAGGFASPQAAVSNAISTFNGRYHLFSWP